MGEGGSEKSVLSGIVVFFNDIPKLVVQLIPEKEREEDKIWNSQKYVRFTNCYAYAFNMLENPLNSAKPLLEERRFPQEDGLQPGVLAKQGKAKQGEKANFSFNMPKGDKMTKEERELYFDGTKLSNEVLIKIVTADMDAAEITFLPYEDGMTGGYKVALVVRKGEDWHWYRQDPKDKSWSHKQGPQRVTRRVGAIRFGKDDTDQKPDRDQLGNDIKGEAKKIGYGEFVGYFYVRKDDA